MSLVLRDVRARVTVAAPGVLALALAAAAIGLVTLKYGISWHPEWARLHDAAVNWPSMSESALITAGDRALLSNISLAWVAGALGATTIPAYFALCWAAVMIALLLPFAMRRDSAAFARLAFIIIAGGSLAPVLLAWVGGYDAIVVIAAVVAALARRPWLAAVGWLLMGFSHSAVAVAGLILWAPVMWAGSRDNERARAVRLTSGVAAVVAGWLAIRMLTDSWGGSTDRYALFAAIDPAAIAASYLSAAPLVLFGALGVGWLLMVDRQLWALRSSRTMLVVTLLAAIVLPLVAVDQTRIVALALVAATMAWIDDCSTRADLAPGTEGGRLWPTWAVAAAIVPVPVVWMGAVLYPGWGAIDDWLVLLGI